MASSEPPPDPLPESSLAGPGRVTIRCRENGPLVVEMPAAGIELRVTDHRGQEFPLPTHKRAVALCRCGHTGSRPFCDGSHKAAGFAAADRAANRAPPAEKPGETPG